MRSAIVNLNVGAQPLGDYVELKELAGCRCLAALFSRVPFTCATVVSGQVG